MKIARPIEIQRERQIASPPKFFENRLLYHLASMSKTADNKHHISGHTADGASYPPVVQVQANVVGDIHIIDSDGGLVGGGHDEIILTRFVER